MIMQEQIELKQQTNKYKNDIGFTRRNVFGVSTWGHQSLEMREREWLLAYRSSAVRKLSVYNKCELRQREKRKGEVLGHHM